MNTFDAIMIVEGVEPASFDEQQAAWQHLIDTGVCWNLQGHFGRTAYDLIQKRICNPPPEHYGKIKLGPRIEGNAA